MDNRYQAILTLPLPRTVRLSKRGRSSVKVLVRIAVVVEIWILAALYVGWNRTHSLGALWQHYSLGFYAAVVFPSAILAFTPALQRQRMLLTNGQVSVARITSRYRTNNSGPFYVKFSFHDDQGNLFERDSVDSTNLLREGSSMLVYYNRDEMDALVAQCAAYYEIEVPGFKSDYVDDAG
jgi:hypothetical protein